MLTCGIAGAATFIAQQTLHIDQDDSTAFEVTNNNQTGKNVYAEVRVGTFHCRGDLYSTGPSYTDGSILAPNETGFVAESPCDGLNIKSNPDTYTRFTFSHLEGGRITPNGTEFQGSGNGYLFLKNRVSNAEGGVLADDGGNIYIGSHTNNPFHLMANNVAKATVYPDGGVEIWPSESCPAPQHGGVSLCVNSAGQLVAVGKNGTTTTLAQP